jgi:fructose-1,6-bisphosphatase I
VHSSNSVVTIERFIIEQERLVPEATGELSNLLYDVCLAAKIISRNVRRAGLADILGEMGTTNVQGELQQKLDVFANETIRNSVQHTGRTCVLASEEDEEPVPVPAGLPVGKYVLLYDPLDGSSNIDVNVPIGTIFSIHRRLTPEGGPGTLQDCLQPGRTQVAAGYILYGSSTVLVYTTGKGAHGFTLEPSIGEFLLSHPHIRTPEVGKGSLVRRRPSRGCRVQKWRARHFGPERALRGIPRGRFSSQSPVGGNLPLSRGQEISQGQTATVV